MNRDHTSPQRCATIDLRTGDIVRMAAEMVSIKQVRVGQPVSYGGEYTTRSDTVLGLVAAGYAEGVPRTAMGAPVTVAGRVCSIAGRVAMDQLVVDLGPDATEQPGSEAVFWGEGGLSLQEWAEAAAIPADAVRSYLGPRTAIAISTRVDTADEMESIGALLASVLTAGDAVILTGELGAGKTTLTRGLGAALGARGTVQSPTFVIARTHETDSVPLLHVDAYRLGDGALLADLDLDFEGSITVAEWGAPLTNALAAWFDVRIDRASGADADPLDPDADDPRTLTIRAGGALSRERLLPLLRTSIPEAL